MDFLGPALLFVASLAAGIIVNLISSDLYDRCNNFSCWLIRKATARLPQDLRERYFEEWCAHLDDMPGQLSKIYHAAGCYFGACSLANSTIERDRISYLVISLRGRNYESIWISRGRWLRPNDLKWLVLTVWKNFWGGECRFGLSIERRTPNNLDIHPKREHGSIEMEKRLHGSINLGEKGAIAMEWRLRPESRTEDK